MLDQAVSMTAQAATCLVHFLGVCGLTAYLVVSTPRRSVVRFGALPALGYLAHRLLLELGRVSNSIIFGSVYIGNTMIVLLQCVNFLIVRSYDEQDLVRAGIYKAADPVSVRTWRALVLLLNLRGRDTVWQDRNMHEFPEYCLTTTTKAGEKGGTAAKTTQKPAVHRGRFITRQLAVFAWQYLFADLAYSMGAVADPEMDEKMFGAGSEFAYVSATPEQWVAKLVVGVFGGFGPGRTSIDMWYRALAIMFVASGANEPEYWPPLFGSVGEAYTLRRVWSQFWHQLTRWPLSSISNLLARDVLCLKKGTYVERAVNTFLAFLCSGVMHVVIDLYRGIALADSPSMMFFTFSAIGIWVEDVALMLWRRVVGTRSGSKPALWQKTVGFVWVIFWLMLTAPWFVFPQARMPLENRWPVPVGVCEHIGLPTAQVLLVGGGIIIKFYFGGQV